MHACIYRPSVIPRLWLVHEGHVDTLAARHLSIHRCLVSGIVEVIEHDTRLGGLTGVCLAIAIDTLALTRHHTRE